LHSKFSIARTLCEGNLIPSHWSCSRVKSHACFLWFCHAGSLAWACDRAGLAESSPTYMGWAELSPKNIKKIWKIKNMCMHTKKYKFILSVYSLTSESGIKNTDLFIYLF
jgi:hypothetical protein